MGLDMYLNGNAYFYSLTEDEMRVHPTRIPAGLLEKASRFARLYRRAIRRWR